MDESAKLRRLFEKLFEKRAQENVALAMCAARVEEAPDYTGEIQFSGVEVGEV